MTAEALNAPFRHAVGRTLSVLMAVPLSLVLLIHPASMLDANGHYSHGLLMLIMWGVAGGFVHGVGFEPRALASSAVSPACCARSTGRSRSAGRGCF
ncbi:hypothetical protein AO263_18630 [Pseudomonas sp. NZIPFR-PS5]|nr:hypothetical protein AO263_18630 [Pseudomonas sp. NZIPFR-PS5]